MSLPKLELRLLAFSGACWLLGTIRAFGLLPALPQLAPRIYVLYSLAAALGWLLGNLHLRRRGRLEPAQRRWSRMIFLFGPPGVSYVLWTLHPAEVLYAAPLIPLFALAIYLIFFAVPVLLRPSSRP